MSSTKRKRVDDVPVAANPGRLNATYLLGDKLGMGAFGIVYAATHRKTKQSVAIKQIDKAQYAKSGRDGLLQREIEMMHQVCQRPAEIEMTRRPETRSPVPEHTEANPWDPPCQVNKLGNAHLVGMLDVFEDRKQLNIVMEIQHGGELFDRIVEVLLFFSLCAALCPFSLSLCAALTRHSPSPQLQLEVWHLLRERRGAGGGAGGRLESLTPRHTLTARAVAQVRDHSSHTSLRSHLAPVTH
jgi:serine/threonine protein kinase